MELHMSRLGRRDVLMRAGAWSALAFGGMLTSREALAIDEEFAFNAPSMHEALRALGGIPAVGSQIVLTAPDVAENSAVVPVTVECSLPGVKEIFVVVEANPNPLCVRFSIPEGTEPFVSTRIKMAESSKLYAVVRADGKLYAASKSTTVTIGGCG
jgi:sulfur-oxidizing protein SoxY